ncbi:ubiquitin thioesterase zranb1-B-like [Watersipora subatra]|uniref:ubiquitin thioesterase zranb1-B-like n=1 Tax=Watersipora subatra TaxID=2589382 RepID=UPI00355B7B22
MADETKPKWDCEYCTYQNWDTAKKCTICSAQRPPKFITESPQCPDIYQVASLNDNNQSVQRRNVDTNKWACPKCTYLNYLKAKKCTVCLTRKPSTDSSSSIAMILEPLTINTNNVNDDQQAEVYSPSSQMGVNCASPNDNQAASNKRNSPGSSGNSDSNNDRNRSYVSSIFKNYQNKWCCIVCTYENWPKSNRCVLCGNQRSPSIKDLSQSCSLSPVSSHQYSPPNSPRGAAASIPSKKSSKKIDHNHALQRIHGKLSEIDWLWLKACLGIYDGDRMAVDAFLTCGGDVARQLSSEEASLVGDGKKFKKGATLLHIALQSQREDIITLLLTASVTSQTKKRLPPHTCPDLANEILRTVACSLRQRKGNFPCFFFTECVTFALPGDIEDLLPSIEKQLLRDILDQDVQRELEIEESTINWSLELCETYGSRLYALWNRSSGDCLLDSVLQATWGVFDKDNTLRLSLFDSLSEGERTFYPRWKEYENRQAEMYQFSLEEEQWDQDWSYILSLARQPGSALEQMHIFALAHILRRPIIVYGVKYVKTFRGESIDLAKFQGVYIPFLWDSSFCWKSPISLGYTRGHFSALVPMETDLDKNIGAGAMPDNKEEKRFYLPLIDKDGIPLPLHFLTQSQIKRERDILQEWLNCGDVAGIFCAEQQLGRQPPLVKQMTEEWMDRYRHLSQAMAAAGMGRRGKSRRGTPHLCSEDLDDEQICS